MVSSNKWEHLLKFTINLKPEFVCDFIGDINVLSEETVHEILESNPNIPLEVKKDIFV